MHPSPASQLLWGCSCCRCGGWLLPGYRGSRRTGAPPTSVPMEPQWPIQCPRPPEVRGEREGDGRGRGEEEVKERDGGREEEKDREMNEWEISKKEGEKERE